MGRLRNHGCWREPQPKSAERLSKKQLSLAIISTIVSLSAIYLAMPGISIRSAGAQSIAQATTAVTYPTLAAGSVGESVSRLQATLKLLGFYQGSVDGTYSATTQAAVSRFQAAAGIPIDGIVGPSTWRKLLPVPGDVAAVAATPAEPVTPPVAQPAPAEPIASGPPILRPNAEGSAVEQLQRELQTLGYYDGPIDGIYGEGTQRAVEEFQADQQLEVDAIVGPSTWDALTRALG